MYIYIYILFFENSHCVRLALSLCENHDVSTAHVPCIGTLLLCADAVCRTVCRHVNKINNWENAETASFAFNKFLLCVIRSASLLKQCRRKRLWHDLHVWVSRIFGKALLKIYSLCFNILAYLFLCISLNWSVFSFQKIPLSYNTSVRFPRYNLFIYAEGWVLNI